MRVLSWFWVFSIYFLIRAGECQENHTSVEEEDDEDYGKTWMYIPDGDDTPRIANLTKDPEENTNDYLEAYVNFYLFTRRDPNNYSEIFLDSGDSMNNEVESTQAYRRYFDPKSDVKIVTHGWLSSSESDAVVLIRDAYLQTRNLNVIAVDWERLSNNPFYYMSARNTQSVGKKTARLIDYLIMEFDMTLNQFHLIGHSLGSHVCGYAGRNVKSGKVARITGLDPAKPGFEDFAIELTGLNPGDAQFVDAIHTAAGIVGYYSNLGHLDFYPNGGTPPQPGCGGIFPMLEACSHGRSYRYFAESIFFPRGFLAWRCDSAKAARSGNCDTEEKHSENSVYATFMGEDTSKSAKGPFYLKTESEPPYHNYND